MLWRHFTNKRHTGTEKELLAAEYLKEKGYEILDQNYYTRFSEIDLIARSPVQNMFCFVEVKYRKNPLAGHPLEAVTARKQGKLRSAARVYLMMRGISIDEATVRFDVVGILGDEFTHIENAF